MRTVSIYESGDVVRFRRRGKEYTGKVLAKWARGEGDGYSVEVADDCLDVHARNIVGLAA